MYRSLTTLLLLLAALTGQAWGAVASSASLMVSINVTIDPAAMPPMFNAAVTGDSNGDGYLDRLTLTFSTPVDIVDGGGASDGFNAITLSGGYVIANQDYSATNVTILVLRLVPGGVPDTGVVTSPTYRSGFSSSIVRTSNGQVMGDTTTVVGSDGAPPVFLGMAPVAGAAVSDTSLTYALSEPLVSGTATWTRVGGSADPLAHAQALSGAELAQGAHNGITLAANPTLVDGAIYDLALTGVDAAGNNALTALSAGIVFQQGKRPRIVSEAPLWVVTGLPWTYDVVVDMRELRPAHALNLNDSLSFALVGAPPGITITKTGLTTARVQWPTAASSGPHERVVITVSDTVSGTSDRQEVLLYVVPIPMGGG
jgi:hypothetical protein